MLECYFVVGSLTYPGPQVCIAVFITKWAVSLCGSALNKSWHNVLQHNALTFDIKTQEDMTRQNYAFYFELRC